MSKKVNSLFKLEVLVNEFTFSFDFKEAELFSSFIFVIFELDFVLFFHE